MPLSNPNLVQTLMGWNQVVYIDEAGGLVPSASGKVLRVTDYELGSRQEGDAPDYITGLQDRTAFTKGPVTIEGTMSYPLTFETGVNTLNGLTMFNIGAGLAADIQDTFSIASTAGEVTSGCKIQSTNISCNAGEPVQCSSTIWGISSDTENTSWASFSRTETPTPLWGTPSGVSVAGNFTTAQIPMWDAVRVTGAPAGMLIVGFSIQIENQLQRNYTMGNGTSAEALRSPWGLNATSISAGQRRVTGSVTWQSNDSGLISAIMGAGVESLEIEIGSAATSGMKMTMSQCLWNAQPPKLGTGDRVTIESGFTALGAGVSDLDAFVLLVY